VRKWLTRFDELGVAGLRDRTSKPHRQPLKTAPSWENQILELRAERMTEQRIAHSLSLPKSTVARVLARHGQSRLPPLHPPPPVVRQLQTAHRCSAPHGCAITTSTGHTTAWTQCRPSAAYRALR